jgi:pyruvate-formate lyase-activating enzyme
MISFSQELFQIHDNCTIRCGFCTLWKNTESHLEKHLKTHLERGTFFHEFRLRKVFHIFGGEPFLSPILPDVLTLLKNRGVHTCVWSNGLPNILDYANIFPLIDHLVLYLPCPDHDQFRDITGDNRYEDWKVTLLHLQRKRLPVSVHFPLRSGLVEFLPDAYELTRSFNTPLILHYPKHHEFSQETLDYIYRFRWIKNVMIFKTDPPPFSACQVFPFGGINNPLQISLNMATTALSSLKNKLGL